MTAPTPAFVTVDIVALHEVGETALWEVLLVKRKNEPFKGQWVLPGGFVDPDETVEEAAPREFREETGLDFPMNDFMLRFSASQPGRDPRGRTISLVYETALLDTDVPQIKAADDAADAKLVSLPVALTMGLGFDHNEILYRIIHQRGYYLNDR